MLAKQQEDRERARKEQEEKRNREMLDAMLAKEMQA
jgi:hypothetical protein